MSNHNLFIHGADGACEPASSQQILAAARHVLAHRVRRGASLDSPQKVREYLTVRLGHLDHEIFGVILADQRHRVIEYVELFRGTIDGASVHPREVVKLALCGSAHGLELFGPVYSCRVIITLSTPGVRYEESSRSQSRRGQP